MLKNYKAEDWPKVCELWGISGGPWTLCVNVCEKEHLKADPPMGSWPKRKLETITSKEQNQSEDISPSDAWHIRSPNQELTIKIQIVFKILNISYLFLNPSGVVLSEFLA